VPVFINIFLLSILIINKKKFFKLLYILILSITINIMISTYHIGIEQNIFSESKICTSKDNILNKDELLKQLEKKNDAGCSKVTFKLFGLSLSTLNFFTNIVFLLLCVHIFRNEKK
jgi:disulfide bond formation protein DsbB